MTNINDTINKAVSLATIAHAGQKRKSTQIPYILHPLEAGTIAASLCTKDGKVDDEVIAASILHDVIEDSYITYDVLKKMFSEKTINLIKIQSEDKTKSWQERKDHTMEMLKNNKNINVEIVILADKLSNLRSIKRDYKILGDELWKRFNNGKEKQEWYYTSIADNIKQIRNTCEYVEYKMLIREVFKKKLS